MSTHLSAQQVEQYRRRELPPAELLDAGDHLVVCEACRLRIADSKKIDLSLSALREDFKQSAREPQEHLSYQQLSSYVDDHLNQVEREIVDSHTMVCATCKEELRDLFAFKDTLRASSPVAKDRHTASASIWEKLGIWRHARWQMAGAMAVLVLVILGAWLALRSRQDSQVVKLQPTPSPAVSPNPSPLPSPLSSTSPTNNSNGVNASPTPEVTTQPSPSPRKIQPVDNPVTTPLLALNDNGGQIVLDSRGNLSGLEAASASDRQAIRKVLQTKRLETPAALADLRAKSGTLMSDNSDSVSFAVVSPTGTVVQTERPRFRWQALEGASGYTVKIYDANFNLVDSSDSLIGTEWTTGKALPSGKVYTWQVTAMKEGSEVVSPTPPAPEARFKVLGSAQAEELKRALAKSGNSHLARGIIYNRAGMMDEAEREFEVLLSLNPQSSVARKLLENVRASRRAR